MKKNWIVTLAACMVFSLSLSGCSTATDTASSTASSESSSEAETSGKSEQDLMDEENNILEKNKDLWEKVFASMDKNVTSDTLSSNYGDVLIAAVENAKDQFSDAEYHLLRRNANIQCIAVYGEHLKRFYPRIKGNICQTMLFLDHL